MNKVALIFPWVTFGHVVGQDNGEKRSLSDGERSHSVLETLRGPFSVLESLRGLSLFELKWGGSVCSLFLKRGGSCQDGSVCLFFCLAVCDRCALTRPCTLHPGMKYLFQMIRTGTKTELQNLSILQ